jgi:RNA polymerase sigma factor (sigma-70 family)
MVHELIVYGTTRDVDRRDHAASTLVTWWSPVVRSRCAWRLEWLADAGDAIEDTLQDTNWRALRFATRCRAATDPALLGWVLRIAQRACADVLRSTHVIGAGVPLDDRIPDPGPPTEDGPSVDAARLALSAVLVHLPNHQRALLRARAGEGLTWPQLAKRLRTTPSAARRRYERAVASAQRLAEAAADAHEGSWLATN